MLKMGCVYSRIEFENASSRVFQVWNVDGDGRNIKRGKIEVTESQLVLYQKGDLTVRWPLRSLRRYGFDDELFSFECGRRCPTGPGVYAFKCTRAEGLFNILQECIQNSRAGNFSGAGNISISAIEDQINLSAAVSSEASINNNIRQTTSSSLAVDTAGYLEPISTGNNHGPVFGSNTVRNISPSSPTGSVSIHSSDVPSLQWCTATAAQNVTNAAGCCALGSYRRANIDKGHHYVNEPLSEQTSSIPTCTMHQYANTSAANSEHQPNHRCQYQSRNAYINSSPIGLSPGHLPRSCCYCSCNMHCLQCLDVNTNYAKLDDLLKQEQSAKRQKEQNEHFYVNVKPEAKFQERHSKITSISKSSHFYANMASPVFESLNEPTKLAKTSQVNYAILDLDKKEIVGNPGSAFVSGNAPIIKSSNRSLGGYAQIDFDKTAALSHSAILCPQNDDSIRKTRHNAVIPFSSTSA